MLVLLVHRREVQVVVRTLDDLRVNFGLMFARPQDAGGAQLSHDVAAISEAIGDWVVFEQMRRGRRRAFSCDAEPEVTRRVLAGRSPDRVSTVELGQREASDLRSDRLDHRRWPLAGDEKLLGVSGCD